MTGLQLLPVEDETFVAFEKWVQCPIFYPVGVPTGLEIYGGNFRKSHREIAFCHQEKTCELIHLILILPQEITDLRLEVVLLSKGKMTKF
jgi:hypothetical protein